MLFFLKWEHWAVLDISKFFILGGFTCTSPPPPTPIYGRSIKWRKSEERQLMKWAGIFQVGIFRGWIFQGGVSWVGIFRVGIFLEPLRINTFFYCAITIYIQFILFKASRLIHSFVWFEKYKSGICFIS